MPHITYKTDDANVIAWAKEFSKPYNYMVPVPKCDGEYVTNMDLMIKMGCDWAEQQNPNKECVGCEVWFDEKEKQWKGTPVLIDKT